MQVGGPLPELHVRSVGPADGPELARLLGSDPEDSQASSAFLPPAGHADADTALVAVEGEAILGALRGSIRDTGYRIEQIHAHPRALARVMVALLGALADRFPGQRIESCLSGARLDEALHEELLRAGATLTLEQIVFERDLSGVEGPAAVADPFTYRSYAETGKAALADLLARVFAGEGGSGRTTAEPSRELDQLILDGAGANGGLDASLWRTAYLDDRPVGVALARVHEDGARTATLAYLGLVPEARGRGLGRALHAATLRLLVAAGAERYEDATGIGNRAMLRILEQSGCRPCGRARHYLVRAAVESGHLADFAAMLAYLASERYRVEILEAGQWARVPMRFGRHAAVIDLGWLRDAGIVQVMHAYPHPVPVDRLAPAAQAAGALNAALNVPGFIVDERARTVSFRLPLHLDERGGVSIYLLRRVLASVVSAVATYHAWWRGVIFGAPPPIFPGSLLARVPLRRPH